MKMLFKRQKWNFLKKKLYEKNPFQSQNNHLNSLKNLVVFHRKLWFVPDNKRGNAFPTVDKRCTTTKEIHIKRNIRDTKNLKKSKKVKTFLLSFTLQKSAIHLSLEVASNKTKKWIHGNKKITVKITTRIRKNGNSKLKKME